MLFFRPMCCGLAAVLGMREVMVGMGYARLRYMSRCVADVDCVRGNVCEVVVCGVEVSLQ